MGCVLRRDIRNWRGGILPYKINPANFSTEEIANINGAIAHWNDKTNWNLIPATNQRDFVTIIQSDTSASDHSGRFGGEQFLRITKSGTAHNVVHEIAHVIGFAHEQKRNDRDNYIIILRDRIDPEMWPQFAKVSIDEYIDYGPYDYDSVMHYRGNSFIRENVFNLLEGLTSVELFEIGDITYLFLLRKSDGIVRIHKMEGDFIAREVYRNNWRDNAWSTAKFYTIGGITYLFLLVQHDGTVHIHRMNNDGTVGPKVEDHNWRKAQFNLFGNGEWVGGWSHAEFYTIEGSTYLFLFENASGEVHINKMQNDGKVGATIEEHDWRNFVWTSAKLYQVADGVFLFMLRQSDGVVHIHKMNSNGKVGRKVAEHNWRNSNPTFLVYPYNNWEGGWTTAEFYIIQGVTYLFLLDKSNGEVHIHRMKNDGKLGERVDNHNWGNNLWTTAKFFKTEGKNFVLSLNSSEGTAHINKVDDDGKIGKRATLNPKVHTYAPKEIGSNNELSNGDIATANYRIT